ncbi:MAG: TIGR02757 family protein [Bacteroidales bacterium]|nr:TIGR02757 family protein [Bacteroidales bacterium]
MELYELLEEKYKLYNRIDFIENDPISIPHRYSGRENIEISGFLAATLAWGQRKSIIKSASRLLNLLGNDPLDFLLSAGEDDFSRLDHFVHRTFNGTDAVFFIRSLANIYRNHQGLSSIFMNAYREVGDIAAGLKNFREVFFSLPHEGRTLKHLADIRKGAAAKRLNMYLRWMVRNDDRGVDFGIWKEIPASALFIPLDVHTGRVARQLGLLERKQNDWKAVVELTDSLRAFDPSDPVKYDFALFGMGVSDELYF